MFAWDETAFIELFGAASSVNASEGSEVQVVHAQAGIRLLLSFSVLSGDARVQVFAAGQGEPVFDGCLASSPGARVVRNAGAEFVEIGGAGSWPHAHGYDMQQPLDHGLRVFVSPALMVKTFGT
ncbi:hypothetical protein C1924_11755 [Stenotrophomonas sp. ESTM1D_MKCIP4_1]|uniref:hypothetical protein n=1 Tax=Stenotrophomonas sp. ESTM1D_MKCIP4_1 TaxID=2072414 RepID=UPI000D53E0E1|nr:hypothetical protein [Stenotrophomonas sp. ESTM1D_MKCIP4_1]AWH53799.1 hypothetical protein C1924_11755 [Stenotrophomonas sp. ESTM1D_MKCIP4_1]